MNWLLAAALIGCGMAGAQAQTRSSESELGSVGAPSAASSRWSELGSLDRVMARSTGPVATPTVKLDTRPDPDGGNAPGSFQQHYWYVHGGIGPSFLTDSQITLNSSLPDNQIKFYPGLRADAAIGYQFTPWFGLEAELGITSNSIKSIEGSPDTSGEFAQLAQLVNAVFKLPTKSGFEPYVGVGAGLTLDGMHIERGTVQGVPLHGTDGAAALAFQLAAGFKWKINDRWGMAVGYEFLTTSRPEFELKEFTGGSGTLMVRNPQSHSLTVQFEFKF